MKNLLHRINQNIYMMAVIILLTVFGIGYYTGSQPLDTLQIVKDRGKLICGIDGGLAGFGKIDLGVVTGFDADFCRVIAVAIFGRQIEEDRERLVDIYVEIEKIDRASAAMIVDSQIEENSERLVDNYIEFEPIDVQERLDKVESGEIDMLIRSTTWNVGRDIERNIAFGPVIFLDSQGILVHEKLVNLSPEDFIEKELEIEDIQKQPICVLENTTTIENLENMELDLMPSKLITGSEGIIFTRNSQIFNYIRPAEKRCLITTDKAQLRSFLSTLSLDEQEKYKIFPDKFLTKEPLAPVIIGNDERWHDVVTYSIYATIQASELNISRGNLDSTKVENLEIKKFLGVDDDNIEYHIGEELGLENNFAENIIRYVGNYDDIYEDNLIDTNIISDTDRGPNQIWDGQGEGILFSPPFATPKSLGICHHLKIHYHINCTWPFIGSPE